MSLLKIERFKALDNQSVHNKYCVCVYALCIVYNLKSTDGDNESRRTHIRKKERARLVVFHLA